MDSTPITIGAEKHPTRHYTFACCNNVYKVNDEVIAVWSQILRQLPRAKLLIKASNLNNRDIIATYQKKFERQGISQDQVHLMNTLDISEHQNLYNHVDIALDPFPYNGTTTTCDALWMGVPVLALAGTRHSGRVGVSILSQVGLTDWIARDTQDYIDKAVRFAQDAPYLQELKLTMRQRMRNSSLMKSGVIARDLEDAYRRIWHEYQASQHHHGTPAKIEARLGM